MGSIWGNALKISVFGESHGEAIGMTLDGFPPGLPLDFSAIAKDMARRAPGNAAYQTRRREDDEPEFLSGIRGGTTTGAPITAVIRNKSQRSDDYDEALSIPRPSHADHTGFVRYAGFNDLRGGGHFSGRLTAPITLAGALCRQFLMALGVSIGAHIFQIGSHYDLSLLWEKRPFLTDLFPVYSEDAKAAMLQEIEQAAAEGDSLGGVVECQVLGLPIGLGSPMFDSVESRLASFLFAIPAVKGVDFGSGFAIAGMTGSKANDRYVWSDEELCLASNHNGGVLGGITNGAPLVFRTAIKPTPSISKEQKTANLKTGQMENLCIQGRHDPCIVPRAVVVVESAAAIAVTDLFLEASGYDVK